MMPGTYVHDRHCREEPIGESEGAVLLFGAERVRCEWRRQSAVSMYYLHGSSALGGGD